MNSFYNVPRELQTFMNEFDSIYHLKYRTDNISFQYITQDTIDIIFKERLSNINNNYQKSLKEMLIDNYNNERFNIMGENSDNLNLDIIHDKRYENEYNLQIPSF